MHLKISFLLSLIPANLAVNWTYLQSQQPLKEAPLAEQFFTQHLDHFNPLLSQQTFPQKYYEKSFAGDTSGPLFLFLGGESPLGSWCLSGNGIFPLMAAEFKAHAFCLEHRYYGASIPNQSLETSNLGAFSVHQALADIAAFVEAKKIHPDQKVIVFGCSYPGSLAAWAKIQYPSLITGAISSSAPLKARREYIEFDEWVSKALGDECLQKMQQGIKEIEAMLQKDFVGTARAMGCPEAAKTLANHKYGPESLLHVLAESVVFPVQYDSESKKWTEQMCNKLDSGVSKYADKLNKSRPLKNDQEAAKANEVQLTGIGENLLKNVKWVEGLMGLSCDQQNFLLMTEKYNKDAKARHTFLRAWNYQCCASFGFWQVAAEKDKSSRSEKLQIDFFDASCNEEFPLTRNRVWDSSIAEKMTNLFFDEFNIVNHASNIHFTNGELDPWASLSINQLPMAKEGEKGKKADAREALAFEQRHLTAHVIPKGSHCNDFGPARTPEIATAQKKIIEAIKSYLNIPVSKTKRMPTIPIVKEDL